jgi:hypothetical protein
LTSLPVLLEQSNFGDFNSLNGPACYSGLRQFSLFMYQIGENKRVHKSDWMCQSFPSSRILSAFNGNVNPTSAVWIKHVGDNSNNPMTMYSHTHIVYNHKNQCMFFPCPKVYSFLHATDIGKGIRIPLGAKISLRVLDNVLYFV